jgi:hypothetical protein
MPDEESRYVYKLPRVGSKLVVVVCVVESLAQAAKPRVASKAAQMYFEFIATRVKTGSKTKFEHG